MSSKKDILHYIDAGPGSGKTHHARSEMTKDLSSVHFMVVPTHLLADQIVLELLGIRSTGGLKPVRSRRVKKIAGISSTTEDSCATKDAHNILNLEFNKVAIADSEDYSTETFTAEERHILDKVTITGSTGVAELLVALLGDEDRTPPGTILVMTHEAFLKLPSTYPRKKLVRVFFDEARKFVLQMEEDITVKGSRDCAELDRFLKTHRGRIPARTITPGTVSPVINPRMAEKEDKSLMLLRIAANEKPAILANRLTTSAVNRGTTHTRLTEVFTKARDNILDIYVSTKKTGGTSGSPGNANGRVERRCVIHQVAVPSRIFCGYKSVLLMSANFTSSQMFWLLKESGVFNMVPLFRDNLKLRTSMNARTNKLSSGYRRACIIPLTLEESKISSTRIHCDMLVPASNLQPLLAAFKTAKIDAHRVLLGAPRGPQGTRRRSADLTRVNELVRNHGGVTTGIMPWMISRALKVARYLREDRRIQDKTLLVVNKRFDDITQQIESLDPTVQVMSTRSHGLNTHSNKNSIIYLPAMNPTPAICRLFQLLIPNYSPDLDHAGEACLQAVTRTSLRDPRATDKVYIILPDLGITKILRDLLDPQLCPDPELSVARKLGMVSLLSALGAATQPLGQKKGGAVTKAHRSLAVSAKAKEIDRSLRILRAQVSRLKKKERSSPEVEKELTALGAKVISTRDMLRKQRSLDNPDMAWTSWGLLTRGFPEPRL